MSRICTQDNNRNCDMSDDHWTDKVASMPKHNIVKTYRSRENLVPPILDLDFHKCPLM
jgi:hypothetical protein